MDEKERFWRPLALRAATGAETGPHPVLEDE